jgi:lipopolysaccharide/colanic/teichoic acid biosynthesis glycosyltransferase
MSEAAYARAYPRATAERGNEPFPVPAEVTRLAAELDWDGWLPGRGRTRWWRVGRTVKRGSDVVLASVGLVILAPLLACIAIAVAATSRGPILYEWRVLGRRARPFRGYKFRTMVENADELKAAMLAFNEMTGPAFKMRADPRVTRVGRFLRKYSLDELPQLYSVLKGDLSLVGPRAPGPHEFAAFTPLQRGKLAVKPGISCLWQISGRSKITSFEEWSALDHAYIQDWSLVLDLKILLRTIPVVLRGDGAY